MNLLRKFAQYFKHTPEQDPKPKEHLIQLNPNDYSNPAMQYRIHRIIDDQMLGYSLEKSSKRDFAIHHVTMLLGGFIYHDNDSNWYTGGLAIDAAHMRWYGRYKQSPLLLFDLNIKGAWYQLSLMLDEADKNLLEKVQRCIPENLRQSKNYNRPNVRTYIPTEGYITTQNLQGFFENHEPVKLHVTPLWMIVLQEDGHVLQEHFIDDITDIRCAKHPTSSNKRDLLLTFEIQDKAYAYVMQDESFAKRLSDATRAGVDSDAMQKKKND